MTGTLARDEQGWQPMLSPVMDGLIDNALDTPTPARECNGRVLLY